MAPLTGIFQAKEKATAVTERKHSRFDLPGVIIAMALVALAAIVWWDASSLNLTWGYDPGPRAAPMAIAVGLAVLGITNGLIAFRYGPTERESVDARAVFLILAGLGGMIALISIDGGFIPAMALLFAATAAAFGRKAFFTDLVIGFVLALLAYMLFAKLLTLNLPVGPLERLLARII